MTLNVFIIVLLLLQINIILTISPSDFNDPDAYGLKTAANKHLFVQAKNDRRNFLIKYLFYNTSTDRSQCSIRYNDPTHYVYSVSLGIKQNIIENHYFYFAGEVIPSASSKSTDQLGRNGTYIGVWINEGSYLLESNKKSKDYASCEYFRVKCLEFFSSYKHQEHFVIGAEPNGEYAIGLATDFIFIYQPFHNKTLLPENTSGIWPNNGTFYPYALDVGHNFTVAAGFFESYDRCRMSIKPTVFLLSNNNLRVLSSWSYTAPDQSWQSSLTYLGVSSWDSRNTFSVKINSDDPDRILVGIPFLNTVFLLAITENGTNLKLINSIDNGLSVGYGKSVTWLTKSNAAILVSPYSSDYLTRFPSKIFLYELLNNDMHIAPLPYAVFPNSQQPLPANINSKFIQMTSTPSSLAILDIFGNVLIILSTPPGYYASTDSSKLAFPVSMLLVTVQIECIPGTYKPLDGIQPCILCSNGTRNPGGLPALSCLSCSTNRFCPSGAVFEINNAALASVSQAYSYPRTPEINAFGDILLYNVFFFDTTPRCLFISPMFWTTIIITIFVIFTSLMFLHNWYLQTIKHRKCKGTYFVKIIFQRMDIVSKGQQWIGGLASIIILFITLMAYRFAISFMNQYPAEKVGPSTFACDTTIRNAKFHTNLQALSVPTSDIEKSIFTLLNQQNFTLRLEFINTIVTCEKLIITEMIDSTKFHLEKTSCSNENGILSVTVILPQHYVTILVTLNDIQLVGALRIGLFGPEEKINSNTLKELNFIESFYSQSSKTLAQKSTIQLELTKVVNETEPLFGSISEFEAIWYPTFTYRPSEMFITDDIYATTEGLVRSTFKINIVETAYYIKNIQMPIAKPPEIIFRTLLLAFLCLELCTVTFVLLQLLILPLYRRIDEKVFLKRDNIIDDPINSEKN